MPVKCSIKNCKNTKKKKDGKLSWHSIPPKNDPRHDLWLAVCKPDRNSGKDCVKICSDHFQQTDYFDYGAKHRSLKPNAIPKG